MAGPNRHTFLVSSFSCNRTNWAAMLRGLVASIPCLLGVLALWFNSQAGAFAAEVIPPKPTRYFNDYASVVSPATADKLNRELENFERTDSSQIVVAIYPKMQSDSSVADYTVRVAQAWGVGQKGKDNGAVLFVFVQDHQIFLEVGYGLEAVIPDATAKMIIEQEIKPRFRAGNFDAGLTAGVNAILQAARGEYHGNGRTAGDQARRRPVGGAPWFFIGFFVLALLSVLRRSRGTVYHRSGRSGWSAWPGGWTGGRGGGGWGGGGSFGGGGFSSGGGSFGGGGAGGSW